MVRIGKAEDWKGGPSTLSVGGRPAPGGHPSSPRLFGTLFGSWQRGHYVMWTLRPASRPSAGPGEMPGSLESFLSKPDRLLRPGVRTGHHSQPS